MGTPLTVVGGSARRGAAAFSFSQRSRAAVSETVAMRSDPPSFVETSIQFARVKFPASAGGGEAPLAHGGAARSRPRPVQFAPLGWEATGALVPPAVGP